MCPSWQDTNRGDSRAFRLLGSAAVRRVSVVGTSGVGKSTFASSLALVLGAAFLELDSLQHQADWTPLPASEFRARVALVADGECWVIDGNYSRVQDLVWARADTVVWLDLPRRVVMRRIVWRTLRRVGGRVELWNGNRERSCGRFRFLRSLLPTRGACGRLERRLELRRNVTTHSLTSQSPSVTPRAANSEGQVRLLRWIRAWWWIRCIPVPAINHAA